MSVEFVSLYEGLRLAVLSGEWGHSVRLARALLRRDPDPKRSAVYAGGALIECGAQTGNRRLVLQGLRVMEKHIDSIVGDLRSVALYNMASGYLTLGQRERGVGACTRPMLSRAVRLFDEALDENPTFDARVNLANALSTQGRFVEAVYEYGSAIKEDAGRHELYGNRAIALWQSHRWILPHRGLMEAAYKDCDKALMLGAQDPVYRGKYEAMLKQLAPYKPATAEERERRSPSRIEKWIWDNGLNLNLCPLCEEDTPDAFDTYSLPGLLDSPRRRPSVDHCHDMINALHRSYSTSRWVAMQGIGLAGRVPRDHVITLGGSPGAWCDLKTGLLLDAASGFYSVLNQTAANVNAYFRLRHNPLRIDLEQIWWHPKHQRHRQQPPVPDKRADLHPSLRRRSSIMLSALFGLSRSLERDGGRYWRLRKMRNHIQHHTVVVKDAVAESAYYHTIDRSTLPRDVVHLGRLAKASILYFGGIVWKAERERVRALAGVEVRHRERSVVRQ